MLTKTMDSWAQHNTYRVYALLSCPCHFGKSADGHLPSVALMIWYPKVEFRIYILHLSVTQFFVFIRQNGHLIEFYTAMNYFAYFFWVKHIEFFPTPNPQCLLVHRCTLIYNEKNSIYLELVESIRDVHVWRVKIQFTTFEEGLIFRTWNKKGCILEKNVVSMQTGIASSPLSLVFFDIYFWPMTKIELSSQRQACFFF